VQVEHALDRINHGTYGIDESTGEAISTERLRAMPWATEDVSTEESQQRR
jgi:DnaK suppressor protein